MTTLAEERLRREYEDRAYRAKSFEREQKHLTVVKVVRATSRCTRCDYERPYTEGDEDRRCPACQGGSPQFWETQSPLTRRP